MIQRHFMIMQAAGLAGGNGSLGRWPDVVIAIATGAGRNGPDQSMRPRVARAAQTDPLRAQIDRPPTSRSPCISAARRTVIKSHSNRCQSLPRPSGQAAWSVRL
jgi:hypothetical protein